MTFTCHVKQINYKTLSYFHIANITKRHINIKIFVNKPFLHIAKFKNLLECHLIKYFKIILFIFLLYFNLNYTCIFKNFVRRTKIYSYLAFSEFGAGDEETRAYQLMFYYEKIATETNVKVESCHQINETLHRH